MAGSARHSDSASRPYIPLEEQRALYAAVRDIGHALGVPLDVAEGVVCEFLRVPPPTERKERSEPRTVADQRPRAPVGYRTKADLKLEVQREGRLPDQQAGD